MELENNALEGIVGGLVDHKEIKPGNPDDKGNPQWPVYRPAKK